MSQFCRVFPPLLSGYELTLSRQPLSIHPYMVGFKVTVLTVEAWEPCKVNFLLKQYCLLAYISHSVTIVCSSIKRMHIIGVFWERNSTRQNSQWLFFSLCTVTINTHQWALTSRDSCTSWFQMLSLKRRGHTVSLCPPSSTNKPRSRAVCFGCAAPFVPMWRGCRRSRMCLYSNNFSGGNTYITTSQLDEGELVEKGKRS